MGWVGASPWVSRDARVACTQEVLTDSISRLRLPAFGRLGDLVGGTLFEEIYYGETIG